MQVTGPTDGQTGRRAIPRHWIMRKKTRKRRPAHAGHLRWVYGLVKNTLEKIFISGERRLVWRLARERYVEDCRRRVSKLPNQTLGVLARGCRESLDKHVCALRPPAREVPEAYVQHLARRIPEFWGSCFPEERLSPKSVVAVVCCIVSWQGSGGFFLGGHCVVEPCEFARAYAPAPLQYGAIGLKSSGCRSISSMSRRLTSALLLDGHPRPISF